MDMGQDGTMTMTEERQQLEIFKEGMNTFDRILTSTIGNAYTRLPLPQRQKIMQDRLVREFGRRKNEIKRRFRDEPDELRRRLESLVEWQQVANDWIQKGIQ